MAQGALHVEPMKKKLKCDFIISETLSSSYFMPGVYLFLQLSFAMQKIIQFHSDLGGSSKIEKVVQGAPLSPSTISNMFNFLTHHVDCVDK